MPPDPLRVLVTGAGGPAGVAVVRSLHRDPAVELHAADMDRYAAGLYLVDPPRRSLVPAGDASEFVDALLAHCWHAGIDVVVPTVDAELIPLAAARDRFADAGVRLALTGEPALRCTLDKLALVRACAPTVRVPRTARLDPAVDADSWRYPVIVKPRTGSGSRGIRVAASADDLRGLTPDDRLIVQEFLPGEEFSLDVLADLDGRVVSVVPRARVRVDSGVSTTGRTLHDQELDALARGVFEAVGLSLVANVQCRRDPAGRPALIEVNPRFPGGLPLTIQSGVDLPRLCLDAVLGRQLPDALPHADLVMVRFLDERFLTPSEVVGAGVAPTAPTAGATERPRAQAGEVAV